MRNRDDGDNIGIVKINDREREALYDKAPRSMQVFHPALRRLCNKPDRI
jgi:hypothetical protein